MRLVGKADLVEYLADLTASLDGRIVSVFFDLDGTLRHNFPSPTDTLIDQAVTLGLTDGVNKRRRVARWTHYYWAQSQELTQDRESFPDDTNFWQNYIFRSLVEFECTQDCAQVMAPDLHRYMSEEFSAQNVIPEDVRPTLNLLREAGYRLALLSNRSEPCHAELQEWDLAEFFEFTLVAGEISAWKPDPGLFLHALEHLGIKAEAAIYIGDNYYADVVGARRAAIQPVLIDPDQVFQDVDCPVIRNIGELSILADIR